MKHKTIQLIILVCLSILITFYQFNQVPKNLSFDEVEFTKLSLSLQGKPYIPYSELATGHSTLYFYVLLGSFKSFGINNFALRFPSALFGVLNVIVFYFIFRNIRFPTIQNSKFKILNSYYPLILSLIFLSLRWYFNFSRFAFEATFLLFLELCSLFFLLKEKPNLIISGIFAGLAFNSYTPGRIFFLVPLLYLFITKNEAPLTFPYDEITLQPNGERNPAVAPLNGAKEDKSKIFPFLISFLILIISLSFYLIRNPDIRVNQQSYLTNKSVSIINKVNYLRQNIVKISLMFNVRGDVNGRHNYPLKPALNPMIGLLFLAGIIVAIIQHQNKINQLFLIYFIISLIPTLLTYPHENPHMLRTFTVIPSVVYFIVLGLQWLTKFIPNQFRKISLYFIFILILLSAVYEMRTYFYYQNQVFKQAFEIKKDISDILGKDSL